MTKEEKNLQNAMTEGVIWKQLLLFFFPIVLGTFFQQLYNTADAIIVGKFVGKEALAAVGGTTGTLSICWSAFSSACLPARRSLFRSFSARAGRTTCPARCTRRWRWRWPAALR